MIRGDRHLALLGAKAADKWRAVKIDLKGDDLTVAHFEHLGNVAAEGSDPSHPTWQ